MTDSCQLCLVQADLVWENPEANRDRFSHILQGLADGPDLIILPETFTTGFSVMRPELAEPMDGPTVAWLRDWARQKKAAITGSLFIQEENGLFNRQIWMHPDGTLEYYDKRHLFRMGGEPNRFTKGDRIVTTNLKGWRFRLNICYDLRFPVWARNQGDYDVLLNIANWPESRREAWICLLRARAMENLAYSVGVNRVGMDGHQVPFSGDSGVFDAKGEPILAIEPGKEEIRMIRLEAAPLQRIRENFPAWMDADPFELKSIQSPGHK